MGRNFDRGFLGGKDAKPPGGRPVWDIRMVVHYNPAILESGRSI